MDDTIRLGIRHLVLLSDDELRQLRNQIVIILKENAKKKQTPENKRRSERRLLKRINGFQNGFQR